MPILIPEPRPDGALVMHATCVSRNGRGVLICGPSGAGKSALALKLMVLGAELVADDRTILRHDNGTLVASVPAALDGMIEARGVGILNAVPSIPTTVQLCVDLGAVETERLPLLRSVCLLGAAIPLLNAIPYDHFGPAILQYLTYGRHS